MDFVLVHGSTQSATGWERLQAELDRRGHRSVAVELPTDAPHLGAADYGARAAEQAAHFESPVAVAHSLGGVLLPAVAAAVGASQLVWIAALVPDLLGGRSAHAMIGADRESMFSAEWQTWTEDIAADRAVSAWFLYQDCDLDQLRWALSTLSLFMPEGALAEDVPVGRPSAPSTFIVPDDDRTLRPDWMRTAARERLDATIVDVAGGHCPHVSRPAQVADILSSLA